MHELSLVASLFELLEEQAREHQAQRITLVKLRVGKLSGIVPELLQSAFDVYRKGTIAEEARLEIDVFMDEDFSCRGCGGRDIEILEGRELVVDKIELETDDT
jgi:hydrogenase nickel incorporation protein HypA/HybF